MQKLTRIGLLLMLGLLVITGCTGQSAESAAIPTATAVNPREFIREAEAAYLEGDFAAAFTAAQEAVRAAPQDATAWNWVQRVAVAAAADDYLTTLPGDRYRVSPEEFLADRVNGQSYFIIDVREPDEYTAGHIEDAVNIPLRELTRHLADLPANRSSRILLYCHSARRSVHALVVLRELGYTQVYNLEGGYAAYEDYIANNPLPTPGPTPTFDPARDPDQDGGC